MPLRLHGWALGVGRGHEADEEGDAAAGLAIKADIDGVEAGFLEFEALEMDDEVAGDEMDVFRQRDGDGHVLEAVGDGEAVGVDEIDAEAARAFIAGGEGHAEGDGALGMDGGHLRGVDGIERAEQAELHIVVGGRITEHGDLHVHGENKP